MDTSKQFDFKKVSKYYDCVCLCGIFNKLSNSILDITGFRLCDFLTAPQIACEFIRQKVPDESVMIASHRSVDAWQRKTIQGGKCFPQKGYFYSSDRPKIHELLREQAILLRQIESFGKGHEELNRVKVKLAYIRKTIYDYLEDLDKTSLYPTAMAIEAYPSVPPRCEHDEKKIEEFRNRLEPADETIPLSMVECDVDFKEANEERIFAVLANKNEYGTNLFYTFENNQHFWKTSIMLLDAQKYNHAYVTKIYNLMIWDKFEKY